VSTAINLSLCIIKRDDVNVESCIDDFDLPQVEHSAQGGVIASAAIVLDDCRRVLVASAAWKTAATLQSAA